MTKHHADRPGSGVVYRLAVRLGSTTHRHVLDPGQHILGSGPASTLRIADPSVSRRHAVVRVSSAGVDIEDLGSSNGTYLRGKRLTGRSGVDPGCRLHLGAVAARLEAVAEEDLETAVPFDSRTDFGPEVGQQAGQQRALEETTAPHTTMSLNTMQVFTLELLPRLLRLLDDEQADLPTMAQAIGSALRITLPATRLEISHSAISSNQQHDDCLLFAWAAEDTSALVAHGQRPAAQIDAHESARTIRGQCAGLFVTVVFRHARQAATYRSLVDSSAKLLALSRQQSTMDGVSASVPPQQTRTGDRAGRAPALPQPATVVPAVQAIYNNAARVARGDIGVVIRGASGTGKEVLARYIHAASRRHAQAFVALNCAALPRDLLESELFGVERGVATNVESRPGKFELADGGTLLLDEIGDMAAETQAKILRVLQDGEVYRLGGTRPRSAQVRVIAATHRDLDAMVEEGSFRLDLFHRIADWTVTLPPLTDRRGDLANLAVFFLQREAARLGLRVAGISRAALDILLAHDWPGNIRQLEREMAKAALFLGSGEGSAESSAEVLDSHHLEHLEGDQLSMPVLLKDRLEAVERREIEQALVLAAGDVPQVAERLGVGRSTLYRRIKELRIS